jgi:hypothetical protein
MVGARAVENGYSGGPSHIVTRGRTPILSPEEARQLFASISPDKPGGDLEEPGFLRLIEAW